MNNQAVVLSISLAMENARKRMLKNVDDMICSYFHNSAGAETTSQCIKDEGLAQGEDNGY